MGEAFDIFGDVYDLLQVLILSVAEDGIVHDDAVDFGIVVRIDDGVLEEFAIDFSELECEATILPIYC